LAIAFKKAGTRFMEKGLLALGVNVSAAVGGALWLGSLKTKKGEKKDANGTAAIMKGDR